MRTQHILLIATLMFFFGCGQNVSVSGKITFADGSPLTAGNIIFESDTFQGFSSIDEQGRYSLGSIKEGDRIPKGAYRVRILATTGGDSDGTPFVRFVAAKYESTATSGLTCEVNGKTEFDITVEKPER